MQVVVAAVVGVEAAPVHVMEYNILIVICAE
jgi:hypothetical protein